MSAILELPEVRARVLRWSVEEYEGFVEQGVLGKNAELIRGIIIQTMPKSPLHRTLTKRLYDRFLGQLPPGCMVFQEGPLRLADSEPEPDVSVVRGEAGDFRETHPVTAVLVVEVAVSSAALDRENASLYAEAGVGEYWIVLARRQEVEVYRRPVDGLYQEKRLCARGEMLVCESAPELSIALDELFA
jgi:Uma2 family endonuclease